jgi:mono/diheme cytochrome c family protein
MKKRYVIITVAAVVSAVALWKLAFTGASDGAHVSVKVPSLTAAAKRGERVFAANCAVCHGKNAAGSNSGPPLVHKIYEPSHHGDGSFISAVQNGVRQHHWSYGNMPRQPSISSRQAGQIITYVRELQRANGIN